MADHQHPDGSRCDVAHGETPPEPNDDRVLVVVYASPLGDHLLRWGRELGFRTTLLEPDPARLDDRRPYAADQLIDRPERAPVSSVADVVVTDHHRDDLGPTLAPLVRARPRWIGIIGSPRHAGPHGPALADEGLAAEEIASVRRPIGLDIGSRTPAEIALSVLAGLLADRNGRSGAPAAGPTSPQATAPAPAPGDAPA